MAELKKISLDKIKIPEIRVSSILNEEQRAIMASTIKEIGVIQDIVVRPHHAGGYELIAGKSRLAELKKLGFTETTVKLISADEKLGLIMNITENVARGQFDYISISQAIRKLKSMGTSTDELERIFPWKTRWIQFIEELQDLPDDVVEALQARKITPTHVQLALNLPTPYEVHDGLRTALRLEWDTGTFKTFVENRVEQIQRARQEASAQGVSPVIPPSDPELLIRYKQCLLCGYKKPADQVTMQNVCENCRDLAGYITSQLGSDKNTMAVIYAALQAYYGTRPTPPSALGPPKSEPAQE